MSEDVIVAENVAAPVVPEPTSFAEVQRSWTPEEKKHWDLTGNEPKPQPTATPETVPAEQPEPLPEKAEVKPEEGPGDEDQEPDYYGTPEQQKAQRKAFARLKRLNAELKAETKFLREQKADKPADTAPAPKAEAPKPTSERPKRPKMKDFETAEAYDAANDAYDEALDSYYEKRADSKVQALSATSSAERDQAKFEARVEARGIGKAEYFSEDFPASQAMNHVIRYDADGLDFVPLLTRADAERIKAMTDIPGFDKLLTENRERALYLLGEARTIAKYEMKLLAKPAESPGPKPITKTAAPTPGTRVSPNTSAAGDPLAEANANFKKTNDPRYLHEINRLENERDRARLRS